MDNKHKAITANVADVESKINIGQNEASPSVPKAKRTYKSKRVVPIHETWDSQFNSDRDISLVDRSVPRVSERHYTSMRIIDIEVADILMVNPSASPASTTSSLGSGTANDDDSHLQPLHGHSKKQKKRCRDGGLLTAPVHLPTPTYCCTCGAKKFVYESGSFCCSGGEVQIADAVYPSELIHLFCSDDEISLHFRKYARLYNNMFAFSSIGGSIDAHTEKGIYVFILHGQLYHYIPNLLPNNNEPKFLQIYFYDAALEKEYHSGIFPEIRPDVIDLLMDIMKGNPYARFFRSLRHMNIKEDTRILLNKSTILDQRLYNAPTSEEVAAIWVDGNPLDELRSPYIVVWGKSDRSHRIYHYYGFYDPLQYPLLFPNGDCGWHQGLVKICKPNGRPSNKKPAPLDPCLSQTADDLLLEEASGSA